MKAWLQATINAYDLWVRANYSGVYTEHQARAWFRRSHWAAFDENKFIKVIKRQHHKSEYYCSWCWDTGCTCGGIGMSCHGCCPCRFENPHIKDRFQDEVLIVLRDGKE